MNQHDIKIREVVEGCVEKSEFFLIELVLRGTEKHRVIEVYIDGEKNVSADDCAVLSREIDEQLQILLAKQPNYRLEVSSPGIDRPLIFLKQYPKHIGRNFEISFQAGEKTQKIKGRLTAVNGENLSLIIGNKEVIINFNNIIRANAIVSFS